MIGGAGHWAVGHLVAPVQVLHLLKVAWNRRHEDENMSFDIKSLPSKKFRTYHLNL